MTITPGTILLSAPLLDDPNFIRSVIIITEHNPDGAMGFIANEIFERKLNELVEFQYCKPFHLNVGGPMEQQKLFVLHRRPAIIEQSDLIADGLYTGGNFKQVLAYINRHAHAGQDVKLLLGYCGWDAGQLEAEMEEGSWLTIETQLSVIFETEPALLWEQLYSQLKK